MSSFLSIVYYIKLMVKIRIFEQVIFHTISVVFDSTFMSWIYFINNNVDPLQ